MRILRLIEKIYIVTSMLFLAGGLIPRAISETDPLARTQSDLPYSIGQFIIYALLMPLLLIHWRRILGALRYSGWPMVLALFAMLSAAWSLDVIYTARLSLGLMAVTLFGVYLASCFDWDEQLNLFGWMALFVVFGSAFMAIFVPYYGISHDIHSGAVKGLFPHKNIMGGQIVFAIVFLAMAKPKFIPAFLRNFTLVIALMLLVLSRSATSAIALLVCIAMYPLFHLIRLYKQRTLPLWVPLIPILAMMVVGVIANAGLVLETMGRDETLTGRIPTWTAVIHAIERRPWFGYGFNVFWRHFGIDLARFKVEAQYVPAHAHNGYLDVLLGVGIVGLVIFIVGFLANIARAGRFFQDDEVNGAKWPLFFLLYFAVLNMGTNAILRPMSFCWIPYVMIYVSLGLQRAEAHSEVRAWSPSEVPDGVSEEAENRQSVDGIVPGYGV